MRSENFLFSSRLFFLLVVAYVRLIVRPYLQLNSIFNVMSQSEYPADLVVDLQQCMVPYYVSRKLDKEKEISFQIEQVIPIAPSTTS